MGFKTHCSHGMVSAGAKVGISTSMVPLLLITDSHELKNFVRSGQLVGIQCCCAHSTQEHNKICGG